MPDTTYKDIEDYIAELRARAEKSQADAHKNLNPLFRGRDDHKEGPGDFIDSSYLFIRSCDADQGNRPMPCPVFWLSPDIRVAPLSNLGAPTRTLQAGNAYRLTATLRNRGDLMVPSAKVEFWLTNPSLGFDTRYATKIGVAAGRVQAHGAAEISLDCIIPPSISGHRCLFARAFSFAPLDIPVDDYALNPVIDRHVAQLNLNIVGQNNMFKLDWIHHRNAAERLEIVPMNMATLLALRTEVMTPLKLMSGVKSGGMIGKIDIRLVAAKDDKTVVKAERGEKSLELVSENREAATLGQQVELTQQVQAAIQAMDSGDGDHQKFRKLFSAYRAMTAQSHRTEIELTIPDMGLRRNQGLPLQILRRSASTGEVLGGIGLVIIAG